MVTFVLRENANTRYHKKRKHGSANQVTEGMFMSSSNNAAIVEISQTANKFRSSIVLQYENKYIDVKSILGLFTTLTSSGTFNLHVHGPDEEEAKKAMSDVFARHDLTVNVLND
jgi:phosphocarrier protein HPr